MTKLAQRGGRANVKSYSCELQSMVRRGLLNPHLFSFPTSSTLWGVTLPPWGLKLFGGVTLFMHNTQMDRVHKLIYSIICGIKISQIGEIRKIMFKKAPGGRGETENKD